MEIAIAILSLVLSLFTLWVTYWHRGKVKMTRPAIIAFAFEGMRKDEPKVFLRTLLRSTSKNGETVESMFLKVTINGSTQIFSVWAYGDNGVVRGSGIYVGEQGVEMYHHFIVPKSVNGFKFLPGQYDIEIFAVIRDVKVKLYDLHLHLPEELINILSNGVLGVFFDWDPESNSYTAYTENPTGEKIARLLT
jgi:hypothetical protein